MGVTAQRQLDGVEAGTWSSVLVFSYNNSIISLLIACPSLVDEFVYVIMAY